MCPHSTIFRCVNFRCECNRPVYSVYALVKRSLVTWRIQARCLSVILREQPSMQVAALFLR